jgi:hypothetical protein
MHPLRVIIRRFDGWLSQVEGVRPFSDDPNVILRIQPGRNACELVLPGGKVPAGSQAVFIHLWNERTPLMPPSGADLEWALQTLRMFSYSLRAMAQHIQSEPSLRSARAVGGITAHISLQQADGGREMLRHLGFTIFPYHRPAGAFGEFWENFYTYWLMWTYSPASLRHRRLWGLQRTEFWMTKEKFLEKYGETLESGL